MKKYAVMLRGENFNFGEGEIVDFYTTRCVKAINLEQAEHVAVKLVKEDSYLLNKVLNKKENPPMIYLENLFVVNWFVFFRCNPGAGYTFFPAAESQAANKTVNNRQQAGWTAATQPPIT